MTGSGARKIELGTPDGRPVAKDADGVWRIRGYAEARTALRSTETVQAGLGVETVRKLPARVRRPVLYRDGPEHREDRRQTARFFTPRRVEERYRTRMSSAVDRQLALLRERGEAQLSDLSFAVAIQVACAVIGLDARRPGLRYRLERFFPAEFGRPGFTSLSGFHWFFRQNTSWLLFHLADVVPAIRAHKRQRRDDLITHLLDDGCSAAEILGECLAVAAAGMATTREFIAIAAWHLFTDDKLLAGYRAAGEPARLAMLQEILRLEPVVPRLRRQTTAPLALGATAIPAGDVVEILVDRTNIDERGVGAEPLTLRPGRPESAGLSFGDGPHRCPGAHLAMVETDVFLCGLFAVDGVRMAAPPRVRTGTAIGGYEVRDFVVRLS